jgi:hypothetical protein
VTEIWIDADHFGDLFTGIERSSWRWECQGYYSVDEAVLECWRDGNASRGNEADLAWRDYIQGLARRGIPFERVRMLTDPLTEYLEWMLDTTDWNIDSGEDIRWVDQATARQLRMPDYDYYIFDDNRVAIFRFDEAKILLGVTVIDDADVLARHQAWRAAVWPHAIPHRQYRSQARGV